MMENDFLNIQELATHWGVTARQIIEHGMHNRLRFQFLFSGLAISPSNAWLTDHGGSPDITELDRLEKSALESEAHIRRNAAGKCDEFSSMDDDAVVRLREFINKENARAAELRERLEERDEKRKRCEVYGYLRLPPKMIADLQQYGDMLFPHRAFAEDGQLMWLEPGAGRWKERLKLDDLLIPMADIKAIEARQAQADAGTATDQHGELPKPAQRQRTQEAAILATIQKLGYDPKAIPKQQPGKKWVPSEVWAILKSDTDNFISQGVFDKAWQRLKKSEEIMVAP